MNRTKAFALLAGWIAVGIAPTSPGQVASTPGTAPQEKVVELNPFTVTESTDVGYLAENSLAGSRLNTRLRDTAGSVSVFNKEFMEDIGLTNIRDLLEYTVNSALGSNEEAAENQNAYVNGAHLSGVIIQTRGTRASPGMDYFRSITPSDPYRVARYEDSRGPNAILFGISGVGGMFNQSSIEAETSRDRGSIRYSVGSWDRSRVEVEGNKVLLANRLALAIAAVDQQNGGWRQHDFQDKRRLYGAVTLRPAPNLTIKFMGETGHDVSAVLNTFTPSEQVLAWLDNRQARGAAAVTFTPAGQAPTAALRALGVTGLNVAPTGLNRRFIFVENSGTFFDSRGSYLTGTYNDATVRAPDGTPGVTGSVLRINDPGLFPYRINAAGPGMFRDQTLQNYTMSADWQPTKNLFVNLAHNRQKTTAVVYHLTGSEPTLRGDPNGTLGAGGPVNPHAGQLYFDGNWFRETHAADYQESRLSLSWTLDTKSKWLGRHRVAAMASRAEVIDERETARQVLAGRPFNPANPINPNNLVTVRNYLSEGDHGTYRVGDWRSLPARVTFGGQTFDTVWANGLPGATTAGGTELTDSAVAVLQSFLFEGKFVATLGYRQDKSRLTQFGYVDDPIIGARVVRDPASRFPTNEFTGKTQSVGVVYHLLDWVSLIANRSTNVDVPSFTRTLFPDGTLGDPPRGVGTDYGLEFNLLGGRLSARAVRFTSDQTGAIGARDAQNTFSLRNSRIMDAFAGVLAGPGRPIAQSEWDPLYRTYTPPISGSLGDNVSDGYEARITANLTPSWRLVANYSYTDSVSSNQFSDSIPWYGFKTVANDILLVQGVSQNASGQFVVDPGAFESGGTVAKWIELGRRAPDANLSTLTTSQGVTVAQELFNLIDGMNAVREEEAKRYALRPHRFSLFTAYDFKQGWLKGLTVGGGWRWRSANVIGTNTSRKEITGRTVSNNDLMLRYTRKFQGLPGRVSFQINITNLFDDTDIIPIRLSTSGSARDGFDLPGGRGRAYSRFDLVSPREIRFTTTYSL